MDQYYKTLLEEMKKLKKYKEQKPDLGLSLKKVLEDPVKIHEIIEKNNEIR